jgi:hypothetical protein
MDHAARYSDWGVDIKRNSSIRGVLFYIHWWRGWDLNPQPMAYEIGLSKPKNSTSKKPLHMGL